MKKVLALVLSAMMVLAMGMTAFAASPITKPSEMDASTDAPGKIVLGTVSSENVTAAQNVAQGVNKNSDVLAVVDVQYTVDGKVTQLPAGGANIRLNVPSVKKGDNIILLHLVNGKWEQIRPSVVGDGYVIGYFSSLSPVAVVKLPANSSAATTGTSPKTGYWG